jgi:prevent-host-death family protein
MTSFTRYIESVKHRMVNVTEFKAKCLALLNEVGEHGGTITITKRGRPLATVAPAEGLKWKSPEGSWKEKVKVVDDLAKVDHASLWTIVADSEGGD